jgi:hypothetical protein
LNHKNQTPFKEQEYKSQRERKKERKKEATHGQELDCASLLRHTGTLD